MRRVLLTTTIETLALALFLLLPGLIAQEPGAPEQSRGAEGQIAASDTLVIAGLKLGRLRIGQTEEEVVRIFPLRRNHDREIHRSDCGIVEISSGAPDYNGGGFKIYLKNNRVFQIQVRSRPQYHTRGGVTNGSDPKLIQNEFPMMQAYARSDFQSKTLRPRTLTYWVDQKRGIAFALYFDRLVLSYRVYEVIVFQANTRFYSDGCPPAIADEGIDLGPFGLPPAGPEPKIVRSAASETARNEAIERTVREHFARFPPEPGDYYFYNKVDLDGDGQPEILAYLWGRYYCGSGGCTLLVMKKIGAEYKEISYIGGTAPPIIVSTRRTNGWNDLIFWVSSPVGSDYAGEYRILKFDGSTYPTSIGKQPELNEPVEGARYLDNPIDPKFGIPFGR